jgi:pimeloyl-ACP methyl ester carboxylesterase
MGEGKPIIKIRIIILPKPLPLAFMITHQSFTLPDGRELDFIEYGKKDGYPVMYFHGTPSSCLEPLMIGAEAFMKHNIRVISPSRPGIGRSEVHKSRSFITWTQDTLALADHLKLDKFALLGYSSGAHYTLACALKIPDRLTSAVIVSTGKMNQPGVKNNLDLKHRIFWNVADKFPALFPLILKRMRKYLEMSNEVVMARAEKKMHKADFEIFKQNDRLALSKKNIVETFRNINGLSMDFRLPLRPLGFNLGDINFPITFFHGKEDKTVPIEVVEWMVPRIPKAKLVTFPYDGHMSVLCGHFDKIAKALLKK